MATPRGHEAIDLRFADFSCPLFFLRALRVRSWF
jgi:hypothetical protein